MSTAAGGQAPAYAGVDRRRARPSGRDAIRLRELVAFTVGLVVVGLLLPFTLTQGPSSDAAVHAQASLRTVWSIFFVCAGLFRLIRWRLTGETSTGLMGSALFCYGLLSAPTAALAPLIHDGPLYVWLSPVTRTVAVSTFLVLIMRALRSPDVDARVQPVRVVLRAMTLAALVLTTAMAADGVGHPLTMSASAWFVVGLAFAAGWLGLAVAAVNRGLRHNDASCIWIGLGLLILCAAEALHAVAFLQPTVIVLYSTCLQLVVGAVALINSATDLGMVFAADGNRMLSLSGALQETEQRLSEDEEARQERLHDARSLIAALKAASHTLDKYDDRLAAEMKHKLRSSLVSELSRLERVLDDRRQEPLQVFRLAAALKPVLVAERENGLHINNQLGLISAKGRPLELATVVQNLLVNARRYAPASVVRLRAGRTDHAVQLIIEDRGPGVPPTEHERVFERGYRAQPTGDGRGTGLGLYLARQLMREMGGEIVLRDTEGGGASFVLSLPIPSAEVAVDHPVQVGDRANAQRDLLAVDEHTTSLAGLPRQRNDDATDDDRAGAADDDQIGGRRWFVGRRDIKAT